MGDIDIPKQNFFGGSHFHQSCFVPSQALGLGMRLYCQRCWFMRNTPKQRLAVEALQLLTTNEEVLLLIMCLSHLSAIELVVA